MKYKLFAVLFFAFGLSNLYAQDAILATGSNASGSGGSVSFSVGQILYTTSTGTNGSVLQGVQQPFEISVVSAINEVQEFNLTITAFPNPTTDYLTLEVKDFDHSTLFFELYDMNGKLLQREKITYKLTNIIMSNLVPASYFVKVVQGEMEIKTFKIIKNS